MSLLEGVRPHKREARARLSVREPQVEMLLCGLAFDDVDIHEIRRFCKALCAARNQWSIRAYSEKRQLTKGLFGPAVGR